MFSEHPARPAGVRNAADDEIDLHPGAGCSIERFDHQRLGEAFIFAMNVPCVRPAWSPREPVRNHHLVHADGDCTPVQLRLSGSGW